MNCCTQHDTQTPYTIQSNFLNRSLTTKLQTLSPLKEESSCKVQCFHKQEPSKAEAEKQEVKREEYADIRRKKLRFQNTYRSSLTILFLQLLA